MDLKSASERAYEIAKMRGQYKYDSQDTLRGLKHCAGEVIEANEAYNNWSLLDTPKDDLKEKFADELADVIMCILSICGAEHIDIEQALCRCFFKNEKRAEGVKNDSKE